MHRHTYTYNTYTYTNMERYIRIYVVKLEYTQTNGHGIWEKGSDFGFEEWFRARVCVETKTRENVMFMSHRMWLRRVVGMFVVRYTE